MVGVAEGDVCARTEGVWSGVVVPGASGMCLGIPVV